MAAAGEGIRDSDKPIIISLTPDVCKTPIGSSTPPIPYSIYAQPSDDANFAKSVLYTGQKAMLLRSHTTCCYGDEAGVAKGIKSGTVGDICEPLDHSSSVLVEGSPVIRDGDRFYMNSKNTLGQVYFMGASAAPLPTPQADPPRTQTKGKVIQGPWKSPPHLHLNRLRLPSQYYRALALCSLCCYKAAPLRRINAIWVAWRAIFRMRSNAIFLITPAR